MMLMVVNPSIEVYLLDPGGRILAFSAPPGRVVRERVDLAPVDHFLEGARLPVYGDDPRDRGAREVFSAAPIVSDGSLQGYLYVVLAGEQHASVFGMLEESWILRLAAGLLAGSVVVAAAAALLLVRRLTRPLSALAREMEAFAAAELPPADSPASEPGGDEIERLQARFRQMAGRIREQLAALAGTDRARRELVAGVSHDLRTPLTHLQGYLETLLMKESLPERARQEYLQIAYEECLRLSRLVADLFELAKLEALQAPLEREVFSLAELAHDVAHKFRLAALEKGVELEVDAHGELGLVDGDLRLLERVLENLLDNAVRHTPGGGRVSLTVVPAADAIAVSVADTGPGIPAAEVPHVFDRFRRGRRAGGAGLEGAGLGLTIARRALELHGSDLVCASAPGAGTTFRFTLAASQGRLPGGASAALC
jgi:signal transduction histidine kinase